MIENNIISNSPKTVKDNFTETRNFIICRSFIHHFGTPYSVEIHLYVYVGLTFRFELWTEVQHFNLKNKMINLGGSTCFLNIYVILNSKDLVRAILFVVSIGVLL